MLNHLTIKNYALIRELDIHPSRSLNIVTGETGAGKSIMLGAVGLLLGNRADTKVLMDQGSKCIVEGEFDISQYRLSNLFEDNDLDYEDISIIRREISPSGKSRAFINDTPVTLNILKELGDNLMDVHSQNDTLQLGSPSYQINIIDKYAKLEGEYADYLDSFLNFKGEEKRYNQLLAEEVKIKEEFDYQNFLFEELEKADLEENEQEELEAELKVLEHAEEIKSSLNGSLALLQENELNLHDQLREIKNLLAGIEEYSEDYSNLYKRIESSLIEISDISREISFEEEKVEFDPRRQEEISNRLSLIYQLTQKHNVSDSNELILKKQDLEEKIQHYQSFDEELEESNKKLEAAREEAYLKAENLSHKRKTCFNSFTDEIESILAELAIPNASVQIDHNVIDLSKEGIDRIQILFSANKGIPPAPLVDVASGGEFSRFMFAIKYILAEYTALPTIIFDEIDTGVSGEVALKLGSMMKKMSENHQVISISHLPQIAAKADTHYFVYKDESADTSISQIRKLDQNERIVEIAKMIGGDQPTESAFTNARELIERS